jgi:hypothetical protein
MKRRLTILALFAAGVVIVSGCGEKKKTYPPITAWEKYNDQFTGLSFTHPKADTNGWRLDADGNRVTLPSSLAAAEKFLDPYADDRGEYGMQLTVLRERPDSLLTLDDVVNAFAKDRKTEQFNVSKIDTIMVDSTDARRFTYYGNYTQQTKLSKTRVYAIRDSVQYYLEYAAFNDLFEPYKYIMDSLLTSIRLPRPKAKAAAADPSLPSITFTEFSNNFLRISYPDNFEAATPSVSGETKFVLDIKGYRQDCTIRIDIRPAKSLAVEKVFEQNQSKFTRVSGKGETMIAGVKAMFLNYTPGKDVASRAYFLVKNDQVYRIIMNYYAPKRADFLPAFEKTIASLKIS